MPSDVHAHRAEPPAGHETPHRFRSSSPLTGAGQLRLSSHAGGSAPVNQPPATPRSGYPIALASLPPVLRQSVYAQSKVTVFQTPSCHTPIKEPHVVGILFGPVGLHALFDIHNQ